MGESTLLGITNAGRSALNAQALEAALMGATMGAAVCYQAIKRGWWAASGMLAPKLTGARFVPADLPDAAAFVARAITTAPYRYQARILVHASADVVAGHVPPTVGVLEGAEPGTCVLTIGSDSLDALALHAAMLDFDFIVLDPPELAARVSVLAVRLSIAARASQPSSQISEAGLAGQAS